MKVLPLLRSIAFVLILDLTLGCGQGGETTADWSSDAADLVVYATQIPLPEGAAVESAMGSDLYGDTKKDHMKGMAIWFATESTREELEAFYEERLAEARTERDDEGNLTFTLVPEGGEPNEKIGVIVEEDGTFRVFERVNAENARS